MSYIDHLLKRCCERCENGNLDTCDDVLSCPVYSLYCFASKKEKEKVIVKQSDWQEPPTPKAEMK